MIKGNYLLSIIIVNYGTPRFVTDCLQTLLPELEGIDARIAVIDNHSPDNSCELIGNWLSGFDPEKRVLLIRSPTNGGFASGNNFGIRSIQSSYYLLLNSDTLVRSGAIKTLLDTAADFPQAGLISPRLEWPDGRGQESCFRFHSPVSELIGASQTGAIEGMLKGFVVPLPVQEAVAHPQWTSFACVLVRRDVFEQIGLLDNGYFMYFEDVEFCHRARKAGWDIVHNPAARVVHLRGGSSPVKERSRQKKRLPRYYYESRARLFYQMYGWLGLTWANAMWWLGRLISKTRQLFGRTDKSAIERQWLDIWINWLDPLKPYTPPRP